MQSDCRCLYCKGQAFPPFYPGQVIDIEGNPLKYIPPGPIDPRTTVHPLDPHYDPPIYARDKEVSYRFTYSVEVRPDAVFQFRRIEDEKSVS